MRHLMIDIETLGVEHDAIMIQLAGVFFDPETGVMGEEFCQNIDAKSCQALGFTTTESTINWWKKQDPVIIEQLKQNKKSIQETMEDFSKFIGDRYDLIIWSHATFDFVIVQNYLKKLKVGHFIFKNARDIRTLVDLADLNLNDYDWSKKTHNALDDCKFQVSYCMDALNKIRLGKMLS